MTYTVIFVPSEASSQLEQLGTKGKFWYRTEEDKRVLFKEGRPGTGENWAEKACCEIACLLGLPHAEYDLATYNNKQGVASPSFVPKDGRLILGNELLSKVFASDHYDPDAKYRDSQHALRRVAAVLLRKTVGMPLGWFCPPEIRNAFGVFSGYLLLDALAGNQDRHHENWGLIFTPEPPLLHLAPTFDHASSLGRNETDENRLERLGTKDVGRSVEHYAERARSSLYETPSSKRPMSTLTAFSEAMKITPEAGQYWLQQLSSISPDMFSTVLHQIPDDWISRQAIDFAHRMLITNQARLLELGNKQ